MKQRLFILFIIIPLYIMFSQKEILKEDIFLNRTFSQDWVYGLNSMNDGNHYTTLEYGDTTSIEKYSYQSGEKVHTLLKASDVNIDFSEYRFNANESLLLLESESEQLLEKEHLFGVHY